jgi:hypothetical protein
LNLKENYSVYNGKIVNQIGSAKKNFYFPVELRAEELAGENI